jgi:hypothetical protein
LEITFYDICNLFTERERERKKREERTEKEREIGNVTANDKYS